MSKFYNTKICVWEGGLRRLGRIRRFMKSKSILILLSILLIPLLAACNRQSEPEKLAVDYIKKISVPGGDSYFEMLTNLNNSDPNPQFIRIIVDKWRENVARKGGLKTVSIKKSEVDGATTKVLLDLVYGDGKTAIFPVNIIKEDSKWKVSFIFYFN
jgi:hypothetical protein